MSQVANGLVAHAKTQPLVEKSTKQQGHPQSHKGLRKLMGASVTFECSKDGVVTAFASFRTKDGTIFTTKIGVLTDIDQLSKMTQWLNSLSLYKEVSL